MIRKPVFVASLVTASILTVALVLTSSAGVSGTPGTSAGNCVTHLIAEKRSEGLILTNVTRVDNGDGTVTGVFTFCPACSNSQPPCQAPCQLAQATVNQKTGEVICR